MPQGVHAVGSGRLDPAYEPSGCRLAIGRLPQKEDFQRRERRDVRGEFGGDPIPGRQRSVQVSHLFGRPR
jgi:hypothetical protein